MIEIFTRGENRDHEPRAFIKFIALTLYETVFGLLGKIPLLGAPCRWLARNSWFFIFAFFWVLCFRASGTEAELRQGLEDCREHQRTHKTSTTPSGYCEDFYATARIFLNWDRPYFYLLLGGSLVGVVLLIRHKNRQRPEGWGDDD